MTLRFALYDTAGGVCGIAWGSGGIVRAQLPEGSAERTRARLLRGLAEAEEVEPEGAAAAAVEGVRALYEGAPRDLSHLPLDWPLDWANVSALPRRVLEACRRIPAGETRTYGEIARELGDVALSQAVGQALGRNPFAPIVPCHRVLGAGGRTGGFSAGEGARSKLALLNLERARVSAAPLLFESLPLAGR